MVERGRYGGCEVHDWCEGGKKGVERRGIERERERGRDVRERIKKDRERERCQSVSAGVVRWRRLVKVGSPDDYGYGADRV